jgi:pyruvate dehydrogenase E1 component alpha subunit
MGTAVERSSAIAELHRKGIAYNMRSESCDGYDALEVYKTVKAATDHARETWEPSLLEIRTYRYRGHSMSDPVHGHYRTKEEVEEQKKFDPLTVFSNILKEESLADDDWFEEAEKRIKKTVEECVEFAEKSPEPPIEDLWTDVFYPSGGE